jgi:hypothetical protein
MISALLGMTATIYSKATKKHFDLRLSDAEHGYSRTFDLGPGEILFQGEGLFNYYGSVREFTVGDLYRELW